VRDQRPADAINPRIPRQRAVGKFRQFIIVIRRQVALGLANLLFHDVEIVEKPLAGRCYLLTLLGSLRQLAERDYQVGRIFVQAAAQGPAPLQPFSDQLRGCKALGMLLQALSTEKLSPDRLETAIIALDLQNLREPRSETANITH